MRNLPFIHNFKGNHTTLTWIENLFYRRRFLQKINHFLRILSRALHTESQCLETAQKQIAVKRRQDWPSCIEIIEKLVINSSIISHDSSGQDIIVPAQILGCRVQNNICSILQRSLINGTIEGIIHNDSCSSLMSCLGNAGNVKLYHKRIGRCLDIDNIYILCQIIQ